MVTNPLQGIAKDGIDVPFVEGFKGKWINPGRLNHLAFTGLALGQRHKCNVPLHRSSASHQYNPRRGSKLRPSAFDWFPARGLYCGLNTLPPWRLLRPWREGRSHV